MVKTCRQRQLVMFLTGVVLVIQGCATQQKAVFLPSDASACRQWFEKLDEVLTENGLEDPGTSGIEGFPQLRTDRFWASMRDRAVLSDSAFADWLEQLRQLDAAASITAFANLPETAARDVLAGLPSGKGFSQTLQDCGQRLNALDFSNPERKKSLLHAAHVPDAYQSWQRYLGAYALMQYAASWGLSRLHRELRASFAKTLDQLPIQGRLLPYAPLLSGVVPESGSISAMLRRAYDNPLQIPVLTPAQLHILFEKFAPVWEIDTRNENDKMGKVRLDPEGEPRIETATPVVYVMHAYTRWHGKVLLQLIYQIWLPAREKTGFLDLYGGPLDSVLWRVTLSPEGQPIAYDSIHACGCYYLLFPARRFRAAMPRDHAEAILSPKSIFSSGERLVLRLQSRTHYLQQVMTYDAQAAKIPITYGWQEAAQLRSLPLPDGSYHSLFSSDGLVPASKRAERFVLWSLGVASPGAMRQWGTHAIAFVGRRHFDDAFLLEHLLDAECFNPHPTSSIE